MTRARRETATCLLLLVVLFAGAWRSPAVMVVYQALLAGHLALSAILARKGPFDAD